MRYIRLLSVLLIFFPTGSLFGQAEQREQIELVGTVLDEKTSAPIAGVRVELLDREKRQVFGRTLSAEDGTFRFLLPEDGAYRFRAERIGYYPTTTPVLWTDGNLTLEVEIRLDVDAVLLAPLEVTAWSRQVRRNSVLDNFYARLDSGIGSFFTRADIERIGPTYVSDLIGRVPGVRLESSGYGTRRRIFMSRAISGPRACPAQIFIDGFLLNRPLLTGEDPGLVLDDAVSPDAVEGIEVYRGLSTVPAEFLNPDSRCGVVAIWTRRGDA